MTPRQKAKALGKKTYQGKPCLHGHGTIKSTKHGGCVECRRLRAIEYRERPESMGTSNEYRKGYRLKQKTEAITHYGGKCACCGESDLVFLNIDHINGKGSEHRRSLAGRREGGGNFYAWLKKHGYPEGYRVLCFNCNFAVYHLGVCPHQGALK